MRFWRPPLYQLELLAYLTYPDSLSSFLVSSVMSTPLAILFKLNTIRIILLVFLGRIVTALAVCAGQCDQCTHEFSFYILSFVLMRYT